MSNILVSHPCIRAPHPALLEKPTERDGTPESTSQNCSVLDCHECQIYECHQHRVYVIFEESDGRLWASSTSMMAPDLNSADLFVDRLNETLGVDRAEWSVLAARAFAVGSEPPPGDES